jgi:hypothetical protein
MTKLCEYTASLGTSLITAGGPSNR